MTGMELRNHIPPLIPDYAQFARSEIHKFLRRNFKWQDERKRTIVL